MGLLRLIKSKAVFCLVAVAMVCLPAKLFSQDTTNATIDSLIILLMNDAEDTAKADVYNNLSDEYLTLDYSKSVEYSKRGYDLSKSLDYNKGILKSSVALAHLNIAYLMDFSKANSLYNEAIPIAKQTGDKKSELTALKGLSTVHRNSGNFVLAKEYNQKAMAIAEQLNEYQYVSDLNAYMGVICEEMDDIPAAIDYYAEVLALERSNDFVSTTNASMIAIARYYFLIEDPGQSLKYYRIALKSFERLQDHRWTSFTHSAMAQLYVYKQDYKRAEQHAKKGIEIANTFKLRKELGDNYLALVEIYTAIDSTDLANEYQNSYDSLQQSLKTVAPADSVVSDGQPVIEEKKSDKMNGFLQAIIIMIPFVLLILFAGRPTKQQ